MEIISIYIKNRNSLEKVNSQYIKFKEYVNSTVKTKVLPILTTKETFISHMLGEVIEIIKIKKQLGHIEDISLFNLLIEDYHNKLIRETNIFYKDFSADVISDWITKTIAAWDILYNKIKNNDIIVESDLIDLKETGDDLLSISNALLMDLYTVSRILRKFKDKSEATHSVIYAGEAHCENIRDILNKL